MSIHEEPLATLKQNYDAFKVIGVEPMALMWTLAPPNIRIPSMPSIQSGENTGTPTHGSFTASHIVVGPP